MAPDERNATNKYIYFRACYAICPTIKVSSKANIIRLKRILFVLEVVMNRCRLQLNLIIERFAGSFTSANSTAVYGPVLKINWFMPHIVKRSNLVILLLAYIVIVIHALHSTRQTFGVIMRVLILPHNATEAVEFNLSAEF